MDRRIAWTCLNPECGGTFYAPDVPDMKPPHWQSCPVCRASSRRRSEIDRAEAAAALAAKDAEIERLGQSLDRMTADLLGMRDGALVRDQAAEIERLRARLAAAEAVVEIARQEARIDQPELVGVIRRYDAAKEASDAG